MAIWNPNTFTAGDVSASTTLTDDDHLYPTFHNEYRTAFANIRAAFPVAVTVDTSGNGHFTSIASALSETASTGGVILVREGTYTISTSLGLSNNQFIIGSGPGTILKAASATTVNLITATNKTNIGAYNLKIDGQRSTQTAGNGMIFDGCTNLWLRDIWIKDIYSNGVIIQSTSQTPRYIFLDNIFVDSTTDGHGITFTSAKNFHVKGCTTNTTGASGIQVFTSDQFAIVGNTTVNSQNNFAGIRVASTATDGTIVGNTANGCDRGIMVISSSGRMVVSSNQVYRSDLTGIFIQSVSNNVVSNNVVIDNGQSVAAEANGILLDNVTNTSVMGNICLDTQGVATQKYGIQESNATGTSNYNIFMGNVCRGNVTSNLTVVGANSVYRTAALDNYNIVA